jgi:uncharacterized protein (TIGR03067 family)
MSRITLALFFLAFVTPATLPAPALKDRKDEDATRIVGQWAQESMSSRGGEPTPPKQPSTFRFSSDGTCSITTRGNETGAQYTLDLSKSPRQLKWLHGSTKMEWLCIYELDGDKLKLAFVDNGTEPPKKIEPANNLTIYYLRRVKD